MACWDCTKVRRPDSRYSAGLGPYSRIWRLSEFRMSTHYVYALNETRHKSLEPHASVARVLQPTIQNLSETNTGYVWQFL